MRFFFWLAAILIILLILAAITVPGDQKFRDFINTDKGGDTMSCGPIFGKSTKIKLPVNIVTINRVSYCDPNKTFGPIISIGSLYQTDTTKATPKFPAAKITSNETYLGLWGRFWKI